MARGVRLDERAVLAAVQGRVVAGDAALLEARQAVLWVRKRVGDGLERRCVVSGLSYKT